MSNHTPPTVEILSQGDEVVTGQVADTNAAWLAEALTDLGFQVLRHSSVGDHIEDLVQLFTEASSRAQVVLCTGGLGPTDDDLTAEAVALAFDRPLSLDPVALADLIAKYERFRRVMPDVNRKQARLPQGSQRIDNPWGTAPGFSLEANGAWMAFMPGVPREMKKLFSTAISPALIERFPLQPARLISLRTTGIGESNLQERLQGLVLPRGMKLSFRTALPENHIKLRFPPNTSRSVEQRVVTEAMERIGRPLFSIQGAEHLDLPRPLLTGENLVTTVGERLLAQRATLATAESCTGGQVASACTSVPGSSRWYLEGAVTYSNAAKIRQLGVSAQLIAEHGAVSEPVARAMAEGIREASGSTFGLSTTGIAGPTGGTPDKPVGTVHVALAGPDGTQHHELHLSGNRQRIQVLATAAGLDLLRRHLS